ncbi:FecCD family ABC transporter permease [Acinetobacter courvalinii]|uniref:Iron ABC transporter permease n=1 Tax=Acinetobacter courvalinii TaxID=280147 RepID=N9PVC7_9GAMM|nr:iron ABC transporter permease [Acinetobacter courvalinii]ENX37464.1 hypothetical protein F888_02801 [Acinetobacter courvalinii]KAB0658816.1 iron ABC transporter permease [Acinetobacter courvalinii]RSN84738.1 iron ABC transporter permease [Acinetobacter baumannii]GGH27176.1 iron ABC transporter permease [Acinetobacter courvalinii]
MDKTFSLRFGPFSRIIHLRTVLVVSCLIFLTLFQIILSLSVGKIPISVTEVLNEFFFRGNGDYHFILETLRLPRILMALMIGAALALSGLILQSIIRNPLASPDILGITAGASASAVFFMSFLSTSLTIQWLPVFATFGAWLTALLIYILAWRNGVTPIRLVLIGIGLSSIMGAITTLVLVLSPLTTTLSAYVWLTGSIYGALWQEVTQLAMWLAVLLFLMFWIARHVNPHELGDDILVGLGIRPERHRMWLLFLAVALAAISVAYAGAIAFVGLIAPHIARYLVPRSFPDLAITACLVGANLLMLADLVGRTLFLPKDLPAGIFVSLLGTPFFLYLLFRQRRSF